MAIKMVELKSSPIGRSYRLECVKCVPSNQLVALENDIRESLNQNEARRTAGAEVASQFRAK